MNFVLVILDTLRADHLGCYGNRWIHTPAMDALAGESLRFTRASPESAPTLPVRRAVHTGQRTFPFHDWAPRRGDTIRLAGWGPVPEHQVTLAEILSHAGYFSGLITDTQHQFKPAMNFHRGFDTWQWIRGQEMDRYASVHGLADTPVDLERYRARGAPVPERLRQYLANTHGRRAESDYFAPRVFQAAAHWIEQHRHVRPFFLCVDSFDPHEPWDPPPWYVDRYDPGYDGPEVITPTYGPAEYLTAAELRHMRALYAGEVTMVDHWLGFFVEHLRALALLDDTLLFVLADHGHLLGEHGLVGKMETALYPEIMRIPFLIRQPHGWRAGQTTDVFAQTHDVLPTALDLLGVQSPVPVQGLSLRQQVDGEAPPRRYVTSGYHHYVWACTDEYGYTAHRGGGDARLYDLRRDPGWCRDVAGQHPDQVERMRGLVLADAGGALLPLPEVPRQDSAVPWWQALPPAAESERTELRHGARSSRA